MAVGVRGSEMGTEGKACVRHKMQMQGHSSCSPVGVVPHTMLDPHLLLQAVQGVQDRCTSTPCPQRVRARAGADVVRRASSDVRERGLSYIQQEETRWSVVIITRRSVVLYR